MVGTEWRFDPWMELVFPTAHILKHVRGKRLFTPVSNHPFYGKGGIVSAHMLSGRRIGSVLKRENKLYYFVLTYVFACRSSRSARNIDLEQNRLSGWGIGLRMLGVKEN